LSIDGKKVRQIVISIDSIRRTGLNRQVDAKGKSRRIVFSKIRLLLAIFGE